ncbi:Zinc finger protein [Plakobranchus ocellatus]|uniref:Zinc finger protein n=1 Tax=Plakobranchus ocellatus TaxID=259542 RepID=A0AAV4BYM4_9GAST|nr:Zinc finger protein [Plakobranchus ocellatus]
MLDSYKLSEVNDILDEFSDVLTALPGHTPSIMHHIDLTTDVPIRVKIYPQPFFSPQEFVREETAKLFKPPSEESRYRNNNNGAAGRRDKSFRSKRRSCSGGKDNVPNEAIDGMLRSASWKALPIVTNCAALEDPKRTRDLGLLILIGEKGDRQVDVTKDNGFENPGRNISMKHEVLPKSLRRNVISVAHDSITWAHLGIRRTKDRVVNNFNWPKMDVYQRTVKKGIGTEVPINKIPQIGTPLSK